MRTSFLVGLIGADIGTSLSPAPHEREADLLGLRYLYRLLDLDSLDRPAGDVLRDADGLAHASPTGMHAHPGLPVPTAASRPGLWVADAVYRPLTTPLPAAARDRGCRILDGGRMLAFQAAAGFALITGHSPIRTGCSAISRPSPAASSRNPYSRTEFVGVGRSRGPT